MGWGWWWLWWLLWLWFLAHLVQWGGLWGRGVAWHSRQNHRPPVNIRPEHCYHYHRHCHYHLHRRLLIKAILSEKCLKRTLRPWKSAQKFRIVSNIALHICNILISFFHLSKWANGPRGKCQCGGLQEFARIFGDFGATGLIWATQPLLRHLLFKTIRWNLWKIKRAFDYVRIIRIKKDNHPKIVQKGSIVSAPQPHKKISMCKSELRTFILSHYFAHAQNNWFIEISYPQTTPSPSPPT